MWENYTNLEDYTAAQRTLIGNLIYNYIYN